jgi:hypothetical protein
MHDKALAYEKDARLHAVYDSLDALHKLYFREVK